MTLRHLLLGALLLCSASVGATQLKYNVTVKGEKVGTFVEETTGSDADGYVDESTLTLTKDGMKATIHEISHYGKDGIETSKSVDITADEHTAKLKATLADDGAKVTIWTDDQKDEKDVPLATKTSRADATNFWFKGVQPKEGDSVTYQSFDMQEVKWSDVTLKYVGKKKIKIGDKEVDSYEISRTEGEEKSTIYVDDKGDTLLLDDDEMKFERVLD